MGGATSARRRRHLPPVRPWLAGAAEGHHGELRVGLDVARFASAAHSLDRCESVRADCARECRLVAGAQENVPAVPSTSRSDYWPCFWFADAGAAPPHPQEPPCGRLRDPP